MDGTQNAHRYRDPFGRWHRYGPPIGWVEPESSTTHFDAVTDWARLIERGLKFAAYDGPSSLSRVRGDCLEPLVTAQHMLRTRPVAPNEELIDGALYVVDCTQLDTPDATAYRETVGIAFGERLMITKFARWIGRAWYLQCKDSYAPLVNTVVAMVVAVLPLAGCGAPMTEVHARHHPCNNPFDAASHACVQINANAATDVAAVSVPSYTGSVISGAIATVSIAAKLVPYIATVTTSADIWKTSANPADVFLVQTTGGSPFGVASQVFNVTATASPGTRVAIVFSFSIAAGTATDFSLYYNSATIGNFGNAANIDLRVDVVKR